MGHLIPLLLALLAQGLVEEGLASSIERPWLAAALLPVPWLVGRLVRRTALAGRFASSARLLTLLGALPVALHATVLLACGWNATVARLCGEAPRLLGWPNWSAPGSLVPLVVFTLLGIDARARALDSRPAEIARQRTFQVRQFAAALVPLCSYTALAGLAGTSAELRARVEYVQLDAALLASALALLFVASMPLVLRYTWDTQPLARGALRDLFESASHRAGFRCREILVWNTGHSMANAAVVGVGARLRMVFLSDALLAQLAPRELLSVFAHEVGHARRHHVLVFVSWTVGFFLCADLALARWLPPGEVPAVVALAAAVALWYVGFGWLSRRFELDADLFSVELTGDAQGMVCALQSVGGPHGGERSTWRHFSGAARVAFLRAFAADARTGQALRRRLRRLTWIGALLAVTGLGLQARDLLAAYPAQVVRVELALGRHARAGAALQRVAAAPTDLVREVELARELDLGRADDGARLLAAARADCEQARWLRSFDELGLGAYRDPERFEPLLLGLFARLPPERPASAADAAQGLADGDPDWVAALQGALAGPEGSPAP